MPTSWKSKNPQPPKDISLGILMVVDIYTEDDKNYFITACRKGCDVRFKKVFPEGLPKDFGIGSKINYSITYKNQELI